MAGIHSEDAPHSATSDDSPGNGIRRTSLRNVRESSGVPLSAFAYTYDAVGNRLEDVSNWADVISDYQPGNLLHTVVSGDLTTTYEWDPAGNLASKDEQTGAGPILETSYGFDGGDRLRQVTLPSGTTATYDYDGDGRRVKSVARGTETWFVFDGLSVVMELNADRVPSAVFVPGVSKTRLDVAEPVTEYYMLDRLGSVVQLVDEKGNLTQEYRYDPFGGLQDSAVDRFNRYRFVGLAHEDLTGLTYMNARWYDPLTGRFLSRDPLRGTPGDPVSLNLYAYARNNPASNTDPMGLDGTPSDPGAPTGPNVPTAGEQHTQAERERHRQGDSRSDEQKKENDAAGDYEKNADPTEARMKREAVEVEKAAQKVYDECMVREIHDRALDTAVIKLARMAIGGVASMAGGPIAAAVNDYAGASELVTIASEMVAATRQCIKEKNDYIQSHTRTR